MSVVIESYVHCCLCFKMKWCADVLWLGAGTARHVMAVCRKEWVCCFRAHGGFMSCVGNGGLTGPLPVRGAAARGDRWG